MWWRVKPSPERSAAQRRGSRKRAGCAERLLYSRLARYGVPVSTFVAALVVFIPALGYELLDWDDDQYVTNNPFLGELSTKNLEVIWSTTVMPQYYPMVFTSYLLEGALHGGRAWGYHLTNNLLHALNSMLVFWWVKLLFERRSLAWLAGMVFALHPIHVESVAWVTERKDVLSGFFFLLSLIGYECWRRGGKGRWYVTALVLYVGALFSKTVVCTGAIILAAREVVAGGGRLPRRLLPLLPFLLLGAVMAGVTAWVERARGLFPFAEQLAAGKRILIALSAPFFYGEKLVLPFRLEPVYPFEAVWAWWEPARWGSLFILGLMVVFPLRRAEGSKERLLFIGALFLAGLLPVLGLVSFQYQRVSYVANHFAYLPSIAFCILLAWVWVALRARFGGWRGRWMIDGVVGVYLVFCGVLTWTGCGVWRNSGTLWSRVVEVHPNLADAHCNLGNWLQSHGLLAEAMREYERAVDLRPAYAEAHNGLGVAYMQLGEYVLAEEELRLAVEADPLSAEAYNNWAGVKILVKDYAEAERLLRRALEIAPFYQDARDNLKLLREKRRAGTNSAKRGG